MELKEFVKKALLDLVGAVDEANKTSGRKLLLVSGKENRTVEFDVAVSVETNDTAGGSGGGEIKVLGFINMGGKGEIAHVAKNATVSRVKFGVDVNWQTGDEIRASKAELKEAQAQYMSNSPL